MWIFVANRIAKKGWARLAVGHQTLSIPRGKKFGGISATFPETNYSGAINAWITEEGIVIRPSIIFRAYHPPILIGWPFVTFAAEKKEFLSKQTLVECEIDEMKISLHIPGHHLSALQAHSPQILIENIKE
jgi:hypothetical protein